MKLKDIKAKIKKHAPEIIIGALTVAGTVGWVIAGVQAKKIRDMEEVDAQTDGWRTIKINPNTWDDLVDGAILMYRQTHINPDHIYTQHTTRPGGFSDEMNQEFEKNGGKVS